MLYFFCIHLFCSAKNLPQIPILQNTMLFGYDCSTSVIFSPQPLHFLMPLTTGFMTTGGFLSTYCANPEGTSGCTGVCDVSSFVGLCAIISVAKTKLSVKHPSSISGLHVFFFLFVVDVGLSLAVVFFLTFLLFACTSYDSVN